MNIELTLLEKFRQLPVEKQQEVLDFTEFIQQKLAVKTPLRNIKGLWADLDINITEEDIKEMRQEMWGNFPLRNTDPYYYEDPLSPVGLED